MQKNVIFYNSFVDLGTLKILLPRPTFTLLHISMKRKARPGRSPIRLGRARPVISTPYWHAAELLADGRGVLVPFGSAEAIATEVCALLRDDSRRNAMREEAYRLGREMVWSNVARAVHAFLPAFAARRRAPRCESLSPPRRWTSAHAKRPR